MTIETYTAEQMAADFRALKNCDHFTTGLEKKALARLRQAARMMREQTPAYIGHALNVIEHWGTRGNTLSSDDVDRLRALADKIAPREPVKVTDEDVSRAANSIFSRANAHLPGHVRVRAALESFAASKMPSAPIPDEKMLEGCLIAMQTAQYQARAQMVEKVWEVIVSIDLRAETYLDPQCKQWADKLARAIGDKP
jgi:hypothetical protein